MYERMEPFGEIRADLRMGIIASTLVNINLGKNQKAFKPSDFMPKFDIDDDKEDDGIVDKAPMVNEQLAFIQTYAASIGSKVNIVKSELPQESTIDFGNKEEE